MGFEGYFCRLFGGRLKPINPMSSLVFDTPNGRISVQYRDLLLLRQLRRSGKSLASFTKGLDGICQPTNKQLHTIATLAETRTDLGSDYEAALSLGCLLRVTKEGLCITRFGDILLIFIPAKGWIGAGAEEACPTIEAALNRAIEELPDDRDPSVRRED